MLEFSKNLTGTIAKLTSSPYFSTGGDEIVSLSTLYPAVLCPTNFEQNVACYTQDPAMHASTVNLNDSISTFVEGLHSTLQGLGKTPIVWEEMVLDHPVTKLSSSAVILVWISYANVKAVIERGFRVIHAASDYLYLDCRTPSQPTVSGVLTQELAFRRAWRMGWHVSSPTRRV